MFITKIDFPSWKNALVQRINDLSNEFDYTFHFYYDFDKEEIIETKIYKFCILSKSRMIDQIEKLKFGKVQEGGEIIEDIILTDVYFRNETFDSIGMIFAKRYPLYALFTVFDDLINFGISIEILSLPGDNTTVTIQGHKIDFSLPVIGEQKQCNDKSICPGNATECSINCPTNQYPSILKICTSNGVWNEPICQCNTNDLIKFGITKQYPCPTTTFGEVCYLKCGRGLYSNLEVISKCDDHSKKWTEPYAKCFCENIQIYGINNTSCFETVVGSNCTYSCTQKHEYPKHEIMHCTVNGWDNAPVCIKNCKNLKIENSVESVENVEYFEGDTFEIICKNGFKKIGGNPTCLQTGQWSLTEGHNYCVFALCPQIDQLENSYIVNIWNCIDVNPGTECKVVCKSPLEKETGNPICTEELVWNTDSVTCSNIKKKVFSLMNIIVITLQY